MDKSGTSPCIVGGKDIGGLLVGMFVSAWLMLVTLPTGALAIIGYSIWLLVARNDSGAPPTP